MKTIHNSVAKTAGTASRAAIILTLSACAVLAAAALGSCAMPEIRVSTPSFAGLADGAYKGYYDGGMVKAEVAVTISGGAMTAVEILKHECGTGKPAEAIVEDVVVNQNLDVDVISGSTYSSKVILKAIEIALTDGLSR